MTIMMMMMIMMMTATKMKMTRMTVMMPTSSAQKQNEYNKVTGDLHTLSILVTALSLVKSSQKYMFGERVLGTQYVFHYFCTTYCAKQIFRNF
jgi:hypothetical protein